MDADQTPKPRYSATLPGPTRQRSESVYEYRLVFCSQDLGRAGCHALWEVSGGREMYQIALEYDDRGQFIWHCTCADAIYRAAEQGRVCKHVQGLLATDSRLPRPQFRKRSA